MSLRLPHDACETKSDSRDALLQSVALLISLTYSINLFLSQATPSYVPCTSFVLLLGLPLPQPSPLLLHYCQRETTSLRAVQKNATAHNTPTSQSKPG